MTQPGYEHIPLSWTGSTAVGTGATFASIGKLGQIIGSSTSGYERTYALMAPHGGTLRLGYSPLDIRVVPSIAFWNVLESTLSPLAHAGREHSFPISIFAPTMPTMGSSVRVHDVSDFPWTAVLLPASEPTPWYSVTVNANWREEDQPASPISVYFRWPVAEESSEAPDELPLDALRSEDVDTVTEALAVVRGRLREGDVALADKLFDLFSSSDDERIKSIVVRLLLSASLPRTYDAKLKRLMEAALSQSDDLALAAIAAAAYLPASLKAVFRELARSVRPRMSVRLDRAFRAFTATRS